MGGALGQLRLMLAGIIGSALLAGIGMGLTLTPSYPLLTRPTPTPTPAPFTINDPRLTSRSTTLAQVQATAAFKILRPTRFVSREPDSVLVYEAPGQVVSVRQTYTLQAPGAAQNTTVWVTQSPGGNLFGPGNRFGGTQSAVNLTLPNGSQQPATLTRGTASAVVSWTDAAGYFSVRVNGEDIATERLLEIATSLR